MSDHDFDYPIKDPAKLLKESRYKPVTTRDWDSYPFIFLLRDISEGFWNGKNILDVGSGDKYRDPEMAFPGATVYAIDPEIGERVVANSAHRVEKGIVQSMPYDKNFFDLIVSSHSVPQHIFPVYMPIAVIEMLRVMKPGGEIRLAPCVDRDIGDELREALARNGFSNKVIGDGSELSVMQIKCTNLITDQSDPFIAKDTSWRNLAHELYPTFT